MAQQLKHTLLRKDELELQLREHELEVLKYKTSVDGLKRDIDQRDHEIISEAGKEYWSKVKDWKDEIEETQDKSLTRKVMNENEYLRKQVRALTNKYGHEMMYGGRRQDEIPGETPAGIFLGHDADEIMDDDDGTTFRVNRLIHEPPHDDYYQDRYDREMTRPDSQSEGRSRGTQCDRPHLAPPLRTKVAAMSSPRCSPPSRRRDSQTMTDKLHMMDSPGMEGRNREKMFDRMLELLQIAQKSNNDLSASNARLEKELRESPKGRKYSKEPASVGKKTSPRPLNAIPTVSIPTAPRESANEPDRVCEFMAAFSPRKGCDECDDVLNDIQRELSPPALEGGRGCVLERYPPDTPPDPLGYPPDPRLLDPMAVGPDPMSKAMLHNEGLGGGHDFPVPGMIDDPNVELPYCTILEARSGPLDFEVDSRGIVIRTISGMCPLVPGDILLRVNGFVFLEVGDSEKSRARYLDSVRPLLLEFATKNPAPGL